MTMSGKRILIIGSTFFPENSPRSSRATELAKELARQGHSVDVLVPAHPSQRSVADEVGLRLFDLGGPGWPSIPASLGGVASYPARAVRRLALMALNYPDVEWAVRVARAGRVFRGYDLLISIAAPHAIHWGVAFLARGGHRMADVWIADCGDPFMGVENDSFPKVPYFRRLEEAFCARADRITVPTPGAVEGYYPAYRNKICVVPQGFRFEDYEHLRSRTVVPAGDVIRFGYAGLFIPDRRDPRPLLDFLSTLTTPFEFHVFTRDNGLIRDAARRDPRIKVHAFAPREEVLGFLAQLDFVVNFDNAGPRQTPSKIIDYLLIDRPILGVPSGHVDEEAVRGFLERDFSRQFVVADPGAYRIESVARRFIAIADEVVAARSQA